MAARPELMEAIEENNIAKVTSILDDPEARQVSFEELENGCYMGKIDMVRILLDHGGRSRVKNVNPEDGRNLLHAGARFASVDVCKLLLQLGVEGTLKDKKGNTPADLAENQEEPELAALLRMGGGAALPHLAPAPKPAPVVTLAKKPAASSSKPAADTPDPDLEKLLAQLNDMGPTPPKPPGGPPLKGPPKTIDSTKLRPSPYAYTPEEKAAADARAAAVAAIAPKPTPKASVDYDPPNSGGSYSSSSSSSSSSRPKPEKKVCGSCRGSGQSRCNFCSGTGLFQKKRCTHCKGGSNKCISCNGRG